MAKEHVVMGLLFFPRGGSAQVARYLSTALVDADWSVELVTGSLGVPGEETHAPTFFADTSVHHLDYSDAVRTFEAGGSAIGAAVPMHPSYEDRDDVPDVVFSAVDKGLARHLSSVWETPFRAAGAERAHVFHLHHLTPQHDAVARCWPHGAVVAHLHGTEIKFLEAVNERAALATSLGTTLAGMPDGHGPPRAGAPASTLPSATCCEPPVGSDGSTARRGAIDSAVKLRPRTIWLSCHPRTAQRQSSCSEPMQTAYRIFRMAWTWSSSVRSQ